MYRYDIDALYASVANQFFTERNRAISIGGANNIQAKGDGPEKAVRNWIASVVGSQYRVTEGHVVREDGRKSKQIDVIVVRDVAAATMYGSTSEEPELVRAEYVAAVGEIKGNWYNHQGIIEDYALLIQQIADLQDGLLVENKARFGEIVDDTTIGELSRSLNGRKWWNKCYAFVITLGLGRCKIDDLSDDLTNSDIEPEDAIALILDENVGGVLCVPARHRNGQNIVGIQCEVDRKANEIHVQNNWVTAEETVADPNVASGRLLNFFLSDLQLHLSSWTYEFRDPRPYVKLSSALRRRHKKPN
ncbi:MAG: hypothetical protein OXG99_13415 [Alphaproteobacteria bacterium]|nr:hypothetical protein [Alphaproteobacteria bacterium]